MEIHRGELPSISGDVVEAMCHVAALEMERLADRGGWDQNAVIFDIFLDSVENEDREAVLKMIQALGGGRRGEVIDTVEGLLSEEEAGGSFFSQVLAMKARELEGSDGEHPLDLIEGMRVDDEAVGAGLVVEGWSYGEELTARAGDGAELEISPAEDPDRVEMRQVLVILRDGTQGMVLRRRGSEPEVLGGREKQMRGRLIETLQRYVGVATEAPERTLREVAATVVLLADLHVGGREGKIGPGQGSEGGGGGEVRDDLRLVLDEAGATLGPLLVFSGRTPEWEEAAQMASGHLEAVAKRAPAEVERDLKRWVTKYRWYDEGMLERLFSQVPPLPVVQMGVKRLAEAGIIGREWAAEMLAKSERIRESGWQEFSG